MNKRQAKKYYKKPENAEKLTELKLCYINSYRIFIETQRSNIVKALQEAYSAWHH